MTTFIGTGWKMNKTIAEARAFVRQLNAFAEWPQGVRPFIIPPHTLISTVRDSLDPSTGVWVGAQNAHWMPSGAYTGEISMNMVKDAGAALVEIGHSERREHFNETDESVNLKVLAAINTGLVPLLCVGEDQKTREAGGAVAFVLSQIEAALVNVTEDDRRCILVAYEPIWSIGAAGTPASASAVQEIARAIHDRFALRGVLYGGSVNIDNAAELLSLPEVNGLFVGRSAWTASGFLQLVRLAGSLGRQTAGRTLFVQSDDEEPQ